MFDIKKVEAMINEHLQIQHKAQQRTLEYFEKATKALDAVNLALRDLIELKRHELDPMK